MNKNRFCFLVLIGVFYVLRKIMFICTGNICRSAMAEKMLKKKISDKNIDNKFIVTSAGVYAYPDDRSTYEAIKVMQDEYEIDLSGHRATAIRDSRIEEMDLILCMTNSHKRSLLSIYPNLENKVFTIKDYIGLSGDVEDPYGGSLKTYSDCAREIDGYLELLLDKEGF